MAILDEGTVPTTPVPIAGGTALGVLNAKTDVLNFTKINITKISFFNKIQAQQTIVLSCKPQFGTLRELRQIQLKINESAEYPETGETLPLLAGDEIDAETTTADAVDFVVWGDIE